MSLQEIGVKYGISQMAIRVTKGGTATLHTHGISHGEEMLFDIASLTKLFTATLFLKMYERQEIHLEDNVQKYFPQIKRGDIFVQNLLTHTALMAVPLAHVRTWAQGRDDYEKAIFSAERIGDMDYCYQCSNFILLGWILEKVGGAPLNELMKKEIFEPLEMHTTYFGEASEEIQMKTLPTEIDLLRGLIQGVVHDPNSFLLKGIGGNAGIFTTIEEFSHFTDLWLGKGVWKGKRILDEKSIQSAWYRWYQSKGEYGQGLGWKLASPHESDPWIIPGSVLHGGFTGTFTLLLPEEEKSCTIFTNFLYPHGIREVGRGIFRKFVYEVFQELLL